MLKPQAKHVHIGVYSFLGGAARGRVIPSSIPNLEVKPPIADNTAGYVCGNVGQCHLETNLTFFIPQLQSITLFLFLILITLLLCLFIMFCSMKSNLPMDLIFCFFMVLFIVHLRRFDFIEHLYHYHHSNVCFMFLFDEIEPTFILSL